MGQHLEKKKHLRKVIMLEALFREFKEGLPMELLYADDLVLNAETKELLLEKVRKWMEGMEKKGLRVHAGHVVLGKQGSG